MLGFLLKLTRISFDIIGVAKQSSEVKHRRQKATQAGREGYVDRNGSLRHIDTGNPYTYVWKDGDRWEYNPYTWTPIRNVSAENRNKADNAGRTEALLHNKKLYAFEPKGSPANYQHWNDRIKGVRYKSVDTGDVYVKRNIYGKIWYYNLNKEKYEFCDESLLEDKEYYVLSGKRENNHIIAKLTKELLDEEREYITNNKINVYCKTTDRAYVRD